MVWWWRDGRGGGGDEDEVLWWDISGGDGEVLVLRPESDDGDDFVKIVAVMVIMRY